MSQYPYPPPLPPKAKSKLPRWAVTALAVGGSLLILCLVCGAAALFYQRIDDPSDTDLAQPSSWQEGLLRIDGVADHRAGLTAQHTEEPVSYPQTPPVGGDHHFVWQNCDGSVYRAPLINEHAVHSLEHGTVWITYRPGLDARQLAFLTGRVSESDHTMLSPYPGQDTAISVQAWGWQLKLDTADDPRLARFVQYARNNAGPEPGGPCTGGTTTTR